MFDSPRDALLFDTGHQSYVHKIVTGRSGAFDGLRQGGGLSGYPSRAESEHDLVEMRAHADSLRARLGDPEPDAETTTEAAPPLAGSAPARELAESAEAGPERLLFLKLRVTGTPAGAASPAAGSPRTAGVAIGLGASPSWVGAASSAPASLLVAPAGGLWPEV